MTKPPLLRRGPLSGAVFVITGYRQSPDGAVVVSAKHDVTDQYEALLRDDPRIAAVRALCTARVPHPDRRICRVCRREAVKHGLRGAGGDSEPAPERGDPPWSPEVLDIAAGIENVAMDVEDPRMSGALVGLAARVRALDTARRHPGGAS